MRDAGLHVLAVMREPFADKVPFIPTLLRALAREGFRVTFLSPGDEHYLAPTFAGERLEIVTVGGSGAVAGGSFRVPASLRLFVEGLRRGIRGGPVVVLGIGRFGAVVASALARLLRRPLAVLCVELPGTRQGAQASAASDLLRAEHRAIRRAGLVITQDGGRAAFIARETGTPVGRIVDLPNATPREGAPAPGGYLAERFGLADDRVLILHSGGFGPWFECASLIDAASAWPEAWRLVFHTSHRVAGDPYYERESRRAGKAVLFADEPLPLDALDALVGSARIGLALYDVGVLGHRAELMGMASGKIGAYLKNGLPVVATDVPSIRRFVDGYRCGVCVRDAGGVRAAVEAILADYDSYRANARRCFDEIWAPGPHCAAIAARMRELGTGA